MHEDRDEQEFRDELNSAIKGLPKTVERVWSLSEERGDLALGILTEQMEDLALIMVRLEYE